MTILVLGSTGRTGRLILEEALLRGHEVHCLVRDKKQVHLWGSLLKVWEGAPTDKEALREAMRGCEAVISALNVSRRSDFPWAPLRSPLNLVSESMNACMEVAEELGITRILSISAWGTNDSRREIPAWFRWLIRYSNIRYPYKDHEIQEDLLRASSMEWTVLRPTGLSNSNKEKAVVVSFHNSPRPGLTISRRNVARFLLDALQRNLFIRQMPTISER